MEMPMVILESESSETSEWQAESGIVGGRRGISDSDVSRVQ